MSTTTTETAPAVDRAGRRAWLGLALLALPTLLVGQPDRDRGGRRPATSSALRWAWRCSARQAPRPLPPADGRPGGGRNVGRSARGRGAPSPGDAGRCGRRGAPASRPGRGRPAARCARRVHQRAARGRRRRRGHLRGRCGVVPAGAPPIPAGLTGARRIRTGRIGSSLRPRKRSTCGSSPKGPCPTPRWQPSEVLKVIVERHGRPGSVGRLDPPRWPGWSRCRR